MRLSVAHEKGREEKVVLFLFLFFFVKSFSSRKKGGDAGGFAVHFLVFSFLSYRKLFE